MTLVQDMNGLDGGPTTVVSRLEGFAYVYVFIPQKKECDEGEG